MSQYQLLSSSPLSPVIQDDSIHRPHLLITLPYQYIIFTKSSRSDLFFVDCSNVGRGKKQGEENSDAFTIGGVAIKTFPIKELIQEGGIHFLDYLHVKNDNNLKGFVYLIVGGVNAMILLKFDLEQKNMSETIGIYKWLKPLEGYTGCFIKSSFDKKSSSENTFEKPISKDDIILSIATGGSNGISVFEFDTNLRNGFQKKQSLIDNRKNSFILTVKCSKYQNFLVSGNVDGVVSVWDLNTGRFIHQFGNDISSHPIRCVALIERVSKKPSGDDQILDTFVVAGSDDTYIRVYDFETGKLVRTMRHDHKGAYVSSLKVSHSTNILCSTAIDGSILLFDISSLGQVSKSQYEQAEYNGILSDCGSLWGCEFTEDDSNIFFTHDNGIAQMSA